ncbi:MAG TPA: choice-of-anchor D domain-containing protein [Bacteroidota bacterium]|nr:choice-of-anchor D domain-containing protein [Bacteroidota bacterium]
MLIRLQVFAIILVCTSIQGYAQLRTRDDFKRPASPDLSTSAPPLKWVKLLNQPNASTSLQINNDSTISPINPLGATNFGAVAWDSLFTDTVQVGLVVRQKGGNGSNSSFFLYARMSNKDLATGNGYRLQYWDNPASTDFITLQRVTNGITGTTLATLNREIAVGDTLLFRVESDKTMRAFIYGANGIRDSISATDTVYNPSTWYCWLRGCIFPTPVKVNKFMFGKVPIRFNGSAFSVSPTSVAFGTLAIGASKTDSVTVTNTGTGPLMIASVVPSNLQYSITPASATINPAATRKFYITFSPNGSGPQNGNITFTHNAPASPSNVAVTGSGIGMSFSPASGPIGTAATISGANFSTTPALNTVYFGAVRATVTGATTSTLNVTAPAGATFWPVTATTNGVTRAAKAPFIETFSSVQTITNTSLASRVSFKAPQNPHNTMPFDVDGDGKPDLVSLNAVSISLSVYRNISATGILDSTSFAPRIDFPAGVSPWPNNESQDFVVADLDGDGKLDVVSVDAKGNFWSYFRNTSSPGSPSFAPRVDVIPALNPLGVAVADINNDGKPDVMIADYGNNSISIFRNTSVVGSIGFASPVIFTTRPGPTYIVTGDLDGDGKPDLIVPTYQSGICIFRNVSAPGTISSSSLAPRVDIDTLIGGSGAAIGDLDADGKLDIAMIDQVNNNLVIVRNTSTLGALSFSAPVSFPAGLHPNLVSIGDIDGDGKPDLALNSQNSSQLSLFKNVSSPGSFTVSSLAARVDFTTGVGPRSAAIGDLDGDGRPDLIVSNEFDSTVSVYKNIIPSPAQFTIAPVVDSLGNVLVGASKKDSLLVTNTGSATLTIFNVATDSSQFSVTPTSGSLAPAASKKFYITLAPTSTGAKSGHCVFIHNAPNSPRSIPLFGTGVAPAFSVAPTSDSLHDVIIGTSKTDSLTVTNTGTATLVISSVTSDSAAFSVTPGSGSVLAGQNKKFYVTFTPTVLGPKSGHIVFVHNAAGSPSSVAVSGNGIAPAFSVAPSPDSLKDVTIGTSKTDSLTVTNTGTATLVISSVTSDSAAFSVTPGSGSVLAGQNKKFYVTFSPTALGPKSGHIVFVHNATGSPTSVPVSGRGVGPIFNVVPPSVTFADLFVGSTNQDSVTVQNTGTATLHISSVISRNPQFAVTPAGANISPSLSTKFYITFTPMNPGLKSGYIVFMHDAAGSADSILVNGNGVEPKLKLMLTAIHNSAVTSSRQLFWGVRAGAAYGIWGVDPQATSIDSAEGEFELPPPPSGIFDARFVDARGGSGLFGGGSLVDARNFLNTTQADTFKVALQAGTAGYPFTLKWSSSVIIGAYSGSVTLTDSLGGATDMKSTDSLVISDPQITYLILVANNPSLPLLYHAGWDLISVPVKVLDGRTAALFPAAISRALTFEQQAGFITRDTLVAGEGYWLKFQKVLPSLVLLGTPLLKDTVDVSPDWNLIGALDSVISASSVTSIPSGIILGNFIGYDQGYQIADSLRPFFGYWIRTTQAGKLVLKTPGSVAIPKMTGSRVALQAPDYFGKLTIRDAHGGRQTLYLGEKSALSQFDARIFEMPPPPPHGAFDARFGSQRFLEIVDRNAAAEYPVTVSTFDFPLALSWEFTSQAYRTSLKIGNKESNLGMTGSMTVSAPGQNTGMTQFSIKVRDAIATPSQFALMQNYPNPFNPATKIEYALPQKAHVLLRIYDVLGREVATLVNEDQEAGYGVTKWNASNSATSVYFYRLDATSISEPGRTFTQVRKMLLVR